ncbi:MAG: hypothetical protein HON70_42380, partial [Lentisphaerae bacterium]|nr:hypothetical protein [Lentisphaerota bacterium]
MKRTLAVLAALGMLSSVFAAQRKGDVAAEVEEDNSLESALVTPHTAWAKPLPGKPIRVLFLINDGHGSEGYTEPGTRLREAVELMQRLHIDGDAALVTPKGAFYQGVYGLNRTLKLMEKPYDVYLFGGVKYDGFDPEVLYKVLEQVVDNGAGLITCGTASKLIFTAERREPETPPTLWHGLPLTRLAQLAGLTTTMETDATIAAKHIRAYRLGAGRGVQFSYSAHALTPRLPCRWRALTEYDYWMLMLSRAVQWAAGRPVGSPRLDRRTRATARGPAEVQSPGPRRVRQRRSRRSENEPRQTRSRASCSFRISTSGSTTRSSFGSMLIRTPGNAVNRS